jgi:DinB family protein
VTGERAAVLGEVRAAVADVLDISRGLNEEECRLSSVSEGWPAVIVAYHIGLGLRRQAGFIARALTGEEPFEFAWEPTNDVNAVNAREHASMSKDDAVEEIEQGWTRLKAVIAQMTEEDWSREVFASGGRRWSADAVLRRVVLPHAAQHLESLRRTLAASRVSAS